MSEQWKDIKGYANYKVSNYGRVASKTSSGTKQVKPYEKDNGYLYVDLYKDTVRSGKRVHILVAEHFVPGKKEGHTVDHKDRNRHNNKATNLIWASVSDQNKNRKSWAKEEK